MGRVDHRFDVEDGAQHVRHVADRDQLRLRPDRVDHRLRVEIAIGIHLHPFQHHPLPFAQEMPGHDIGVMLGHRQDDLVARLHPRHGPAIGDQVDPLGRAGGEDDLLGYPHAEEARDGAAHRLVFLGGEVRQVVQPRCTLAYSIE
jgi:hypothetical protein